VAGVLPGLVAGVLAGIAAADGGWLPAAVGLTVAGLVVCGFAVATRLRRASTATLFLAAVLVGVGLGAWRSASALRPAAASPLPLGTPVELTATVVGDPNPRETSLDVVLGDIVVAQPAMPPLGRTVEVQVSLPRTVLAAAADRISATVEFRDPEALEPAYRERLARTGIRAIGIARTARITGTTDRGALGWIGHLRAALLDGLLRVVPEPEASLGAGVLLGARSGIDPALSAAFATAGLSHVVAVSGWNVAIVVGLVLSATSRFSRRGTGAWLQALAACGAIGLYVVLTGATPSVVRAAVMAGALIVGRLRGSPGHAGGALLIAVGAMALLEPSVLWDVGFQLSALATAGLIVFAGPVERRLGWLPPWIGQPVGLTVAAQLATLPVLLAVFGRLSLVGPLANVAAVPLVPPVMAASALAAVVGLVPGFVDLPVLGPLVGWFAGGLAWLSLRALESAGFLAAAVPGAALAITAPPLLATAWYPVLALLAWRVARGVAPTVTEGTLARALPESRLLAGPTAAMARVIRSRRAMAAPLLVLALLTATNLPDGRLHLRVLDIGQGDAILVSSPEGETMLVDGGPDPELTLRQIGAATPFFARRIDVMVLTHPHLDHLAGLLEVLRRYQVRLIVFGGRPIETDAERQFVARARAEPGARLVAARAGMMFSLGARARIEVLYPTAADASSPLPADDVNNGSVVLHLRFGTFDALLTGDAEAPVEALLLRRGLIGQVEVLKVAHHGSRSGTTAPFLAVLDPRVALISCGIGNSYGHPHAETLAALAAIPDLVTFRTDQDRAIEVTTDGRTFAVVAGSRRAGPWPVGPADWSTRAAGTIGR
jgi:competence protein ComEC